MMKIEWLLVNYNHNKEKSAMYSECVEIKDYKDFNDLKFSQSIRGNLKNVGFFRFNITKGCDIRYYYNFSRIKKHSRNRSRFKDKFLLTLSTQIDVFNPSVSPNHQHVTNIINVGSYDKLIDAIQAANDISNGFFNSIINGGDNLMFCKESKKLLLENKNELTFIGTRQLK
jgi:hypothetical protein